MPRPNVSWCCLVDWFPPAGAPESNGALVSASAFIHDVRLVAEMAGAVGQTNTREAMLTLANDTATDFNALWFDGKGSYAGGCRLPRAVFFALCRLRQS